MRITTGGNHYPMTVTYDDGVKLPYQPAFSAKPTNTSDNQNLAINTTHEINFGTEIHEE